MSNPITLDNLATAIVNNKNLATQNDLSTLLPDQTSNSNKFLTTDGTYLNWGEVDVLPNQASNAGKFLTTDGISTTWGDAGGASGVNVHGFLSGVSNTDEAASSDLTFTRHNTTDLTISIPKVSFPSSYIAQTGAYGATQNEGEGLLSIGNTNAQAAADRSGGAKTKNSIFIGPEAGDGIEAISDNYGGDNATAVGFRALGGLESGQHMSNTTAIGSHAGYLTRSIHSVMIGVNAGKNCRNQQSVFIGNNAGEGTTHTVGMNIGIGNDACKGGNQRNSVCVGKGSGGTNNPGRENVMVGFEAGNSFMDADHTHTGKNVFIGAYSGKSARGHRNIYIGNNIGQSVVANDSLRIGTLLEGTLPSYAGGSGTGIFKINAGHVEVEVPNLPGSYDSGHPNRIWSDSGILMVGDSTGGGGDPIPYSQNGNQTSLYVGPQANGSSTNPYNNYTTAVGYKAHANVSSGGQWNANFGAQSGHYYNGQYNVFVGYSSGGGGSSSSGGSKVGDHNVMIGQKAGLSSGGHRNIFIGSEVTSGSGDDRFKMGYSSNLLFDGKIPTSSTTGELRINAGHLEFDKNNIPTAYDSTYPDRIWLASGALMIGDSTGGGGGDAIPYSQNGNQTSLYVGTLSNDSSTNPYNNYTTAVGYKAHANVSSGGQWNANFGAQTGHYYNGQFNVFVGYASGGGGSSSSGGSKSGDYNLMIGNESGNRAAGHRNIFVGAGAGKNQGTADDRFKLGYYSYLLFDGKLPTGSTEGELLINATKLKVNSSIKTQNDLASLEVGQIYVDTSAGNVLKMKT